MLLTNRPSSSRLLPVPRKTCSGRHARPVFRPNPLQPSIATRAHNQGIDFISVAELCSLTGDAIHSRVAKAMQTNGCIVITCADVKAAGAVLEAAASLQCLDSSEASHMTEQSRVGFGLSIDQDRSTEATAGTVPYHSLYFPVFSEVDFDPLLETIHRRLELSEAAFPKAADSIAAAKAMLRIIYLVAQQLDTALAPTGPRRSLHSLLSTDAVHKGRLMSYHPSSSATTHSAGNSSSNGVAPSSRPTGSSSNGVTTYSQPHTQDLYYRTPHTDLGMFTALLPAQRFQNGQPVASPDPDSGLYILNRDGHPTKVVIPPGGIFIMAGDALQLLAGKDKVKACKHWVKAPAPQLCDGSCRASFALFTNIAADAPVNETLWGQHNGCAQRLYGEFLDMKLRKHLLN